MPVEYTLLKDVSIPLAKCPQCQANPFHIFMRGQVHNENYRKHGKPYCCVICEDCKEIVGHESPYQFSLLPQYSVVDESGRN